MSVEDIHGFVFMLFSLSAVAFVVYAYHVRRDTYRHHGFRGVALTNEVDIVGALSRLLIDAVAQFYGDMAYLWEVDDEFDTTHFGDSELLVGFRNTAVWFDVAGLDIRCRDLLEGRYKGVDFAMINAGMWWGEKGPKNSTEVFDGFLMRIKSPVPFSGRVRLRLSQGRNELFAPENEDFDPDRLHDILSIAPKDIENGLQDQFPGKSFNATFFDGDFLLAVDSDEKPFAAGNRLSRGTKVIEDVAREFLRDAALPHCIINLLGWERELADHPDWKASWAEAHAARDKAEREQRRQKNIDLKAGITLKDDGTYAVGSRTFKSRADAQAFVDLRTRTQHWAE